MKLHKIVMIVSLFFIASITDLLSMPSHDIQTNRPIPKQPKIVMHRNGDILITTQNEDDTTTETIVFADKIKIIKTKDAHNKFISIKTYDDQDDLIQFDTRNPDDTITSTIYNPDSTKSIAKYSTNKNLISLTKFDHQDHIIQSQINNSDGTITITNFYSNGSQFISVYNAKEVISYASISAHGKKISMDGKLVLAWHEAAHAVSTINNKSLEAIHEVEILPKKSDAAIDSYAGSNTVMQTYLIKNNNQELENRIITSLAGGVAQQIVLSQDMLTNPLDILHFFSQFEYDFDISIAHEAAQEIISQNYPKLSHVQMQKQVKRGPRPEDPGLQAQN